MGIKHSKEMRLLVKKGDEMVLVEPEEPKPDEKKQTISQIKMKKYEMVMKKYDSEKEAYEKEKHSVFLPVLGQCYGAMKNKVESDQKFSKLEQDDDVKGLLELIKSFTCANEETKYDHWTIEFEINDVIGVRQFESELVVSYHKRLVNLVKVTESKWGLIVPTKMAFANPEYEDKPTEVTKETRDEFLACVFLRGLNRKKFGKCLSDSNDSFLTRKNNHPVTMEGALNCVSHYENNDGSGKQQSKQESFERVAFAQCVAGVDGKKFPKIKCHKCAEVGHYADKCPIEEGSTTRGVNHVQISSWTA